MSVLALPTGLQLTYVRDLLRELVVRDLKLRYKRSVMGITWAMINPLFQILIFTFLFNKVLPLNIPNYTEFVFCGVLSWTWFQSSLFLASSSIVDNRDLVRRPGFPTAVLPAVTVATNMIHYLLALPVLLIFLLRDGGTINLTFFALPVVMLVQFMFTLGLSYLIAAAHVTFRDTQHLLSIFLTMLFYLTPVFYTTRSVPADYQVIYQVNLMSLLVQFYRDIIVDGQLPAALPLLIVTLISVLLLAVGYSVFHRASDYFVEEL
jgi:lipopolysaccharide transport system permease protein